MKKYVIPEYTKSIAEARDVLTSSVDIDKANSVTSIITSIDEVLNKALYS